MVITSNLKRSLQKLMNKIGFSNSLKKKTRKKKKTKKRKKKIHKSEDIVEIFPFQNGISREFTVISSCCYVTYLSRSLIPLTVQVIIVKGITENFLNENVLMENLFLFESFWKKD